MSSLLSDHLHFIENTTFSDGNKVEKGLKTDVIELIQLDEF